MYLGMSGKTPSASHSDKILVNVHLPQCFVKDIELNIKESFVEVMCPKYKLKVYLEKEVDGDSAIAKWESDTEWLKLELPLKREVIYGITGI